VFCITAACVLCVSLTSEKMEKDNGAILVEYIVVDTDSDSSSNSFCTGENQGREIAEDWLLVMASQNAST
jgi:hypothetical protein